MCRQGFALRRCLSLVQLPQIIQVYRAGTYAMGIGRGNHQQDWQEEQRCSVFTPQWTRPLSIIYSVDKLRDGFLTHGLISIGLYF